MSPSAGRRTWAALLLTVALAAPTLVDTPSAALATDLNVATASSGVIRVSLEKSQQLPVPLCPGATIFYTVTLNNQSDPDEGIFIATIKDPIPVSTVYVPGSAAGGAVFNSTTGVVEWSGALEPGASHTISFAVTVGSSTPDGTIITNRAEGTLGPLAVDVDVSRTVDCPPPPLTLDLKKSRHFALPLCPQSNIFYTVELTNTSGRQTVLNAKIQDPLPGNTTFAGSLSPGAVYDAATRTVAWEGNLGPGQKYQLGFSVTINDGTPDGTDIHNLATAMLTDPVREDSLPGVVEVTDTVDCPPSPLSLDLVKESHLALPLCPGSNIFYTVDLTNTSARPNVLNATLEDPLPANTTFVGSLSPGAVYDAATRTVSWDGTLGPGQTYQLGFSVTIDDGTANTTDILNQVTATLTDPLVEDSIQVVDEVEDTVDCPEATEVALEVEKDSDFIPPLCPGSRIDYQVTLTNTSTVKLPLDALIEDGIPTHTTYMDGSASGGATFDEASSLVMWIGVLEPGASKTITFSVEVDPGTTTGTLITNRALGILLDPDTGDGAEEEVEIEDAVEECPAEACRFEVKGQVADSVGNSAASAYPISNSRVWLYDIGMDPLPIDPLSRRAGGKAARELLEVTRTNHTTESNFRDQGFPHPQVAKYGFDVLHPVATTCPPRTVVVSLLWDADNRFALTSQDDIQNRYVPIYLARCISGVPAEILPNGPCFDWEKKGGKYVPRDPSTGLATDVDFAYGKSPTNNESTRIIHEPATKNPPLSESWDIGTGVPPDFFMQDAAHIHFFSYKAMEYLTGVASEARQGLVEAGFADSPILNPVLITPYDRDCGRGCTWSKPFLRETLRGRLPLAFGQIGEPDPPPEADVLVGFGRSLSGSRPGAAPFPATGDKPDNREWHELGHYFMIELYDGDFPQGYRNDTFGCRERIVMPQRPPEPEIPLGFGNGNHCGWVNQSTSDSYIEGFAEFASMVIADFYDDPKPYLYRLRGNDLNLEIDHRVWGPYAAAFQNDEIIGFRSFDATQEEFAVAGILWDAFDGGDTRFANIREEKALGVVSNDIKTEDWMNESAADIFALLRQTRERVVNLAELYNELTFAFTDNTDGAESGDIWNDVDEIFIAHGAFDDTGKRNLRHDRDPKIPVEQLGLTGTSELPTRPSRFSREPIPNGMLRYRIEANGFPLAPHGFPLRLFYEFDPPYESYSYETTVKGNGELFLHMAPPDYPSRVRVLALGQGAIAGRQSEPLVVESDTYWTRIDSEAESVAEHTFVLDQERGCAADSTTLCLNEGRFRLRVNWMTPDGKTGTGRAVPLTNDTGYFWFFNSDNVELVVKVLDACGFNDRFWVFSGGLTNVEVEMLVVDTETGEERRYSNPQGLAYAPTQDTDAFTTCPFGGGSSKRFEGALPVARSEDPALAAAESLQAPGTGLETALFLNNERFRVEVEWSTPSGSQGVGRAVALTADTGYFWFFNSDNVEVVLKVLDACRLESFRSFWVFATGLTNVEVLLRVTDTETGVVREYLNPLGRPFEPVQDTAAFKTCG